jgi:catechol 2,3-dioxygenase-like lactoylglutathione lyase family enzyme
VTFSGLDHVGFAVSNLDRSVAWYTEFLGIPPSLRKVWEAEYVGRLLGYPGCRLDCAFWPLPGGTILELIEYLEPPASSVDMETYNAGNAHLCLVTEDIRADFDRLRGFVEFRHPDPIEIPWGPYRGGWVSYLRDPDGISVELMQLPPGGPQISTDTQADHGGSRDDNRAG